MAAAVAVYLFQTTGLELLCICAVHLLWGLLFSKWLGTSKSNTYKRVTLTALALATFILISTHVYIVRQRRWWTSPIALVSVLLGGRLCVCGLTGGVASGKSCVSSWMQAELGSAIIDADAIAHHILLPPHKAFKKIVEEFGTAVLCKNKSVPYIDRTALRELVFNDARKRALLNQITHRYIIREILWQVFKYRMLQWRSSVVLDAALLFETQLHWICAPIVVVFVDEQSQLSRLMKRDGGKCRINTMRQIIRAQMPAADKCKRADVVFDNSGTIEYLYAQLEATFHDGIRGRNNLAGNLGSRRLHKRDTRDVVGGGRLKRYD